MITDPTEIQSHFDQDVRIRLRVRPQPQAELLASKQLLRDIENKLVDEAAGIEFLIQQELKYGHSREAATLFFQNHLEAVRLFAKDAATRFAPRASDPQFPEWPKRPDGLHSANGCTPAYQPQSRPTENPNTF